MEKESLVGELEENRLSIDGLEKEKESLVGQLEEKERENDGIRLSIDVFAVKHGTKAGAVLESELHLQMDRRSVFFTPHASPNHSSQKFLTV